MDMESYLKLLNKSTRENAYLIYMRMEVESFLKPLTNKSARGNVYVNATHENRCGVVLETVE
jgi:hypothetical protein